MKRVISIVEDEKDINNLVAQYLRKEGYEVHSYYTYEEASAHVADDDVHLWILDIMLDDKSGFDLIEEIRLQGPETPVIFMSARDKEFDRIIGLEKGCDDYITKPFSPKELVLRVNNIIKRAYRDDNNRISIDGYELDEEQRKIYGRPSAPTISLTGCRPTLNWAATRLPPSPWCWKTQESSWCPRWTRTWSGNASWSPIPAPSRPWTTPLPSWVQTPPYWPCPTAAPHFPLSNNKKNI